MLTDLIGTDGIELDCNRPTKLDQEAVRRSSDSRIAPAA
jgi:hypothetical protein